MASHAPAKSSERVSAWRWLFGAELMWLAWLFVLAISVVHYATNPHYHWVHDVMRRLYYVPILVAAFSHGLRGGLVVAVAVSLIYAPHAFFLGYTSQDPGTTLNKALEIVLYNVIGVLAGLLADREARRRHQLEQAMAKQQRMADQLVRAGRLAALGELVAGIAHEIKNPLHTIKGTAEIVDEVIPREAEEAKMWGLLRQEVGRLERIAERFLSFARPTHPDLRRQTLGEIFARVVELMRAQVHGSDGVELHPEDLSPDVEASEIDADRDQLAQIALNITSNALRAMQGHGAIRVRGGIRQTSGTDWAYIEIENDGPLIPEDDLERIFDPFFSRAQDGTGLGLPVASRLAEAHGGFVEARNTGGERGVAFAVWLPRLTAAG